MIDIFAFADTETDADIHLRTHRALPHSFLRRALGRGDQRDRDRAATTREGIGIDGRVGGIVG
jgi:hypothetical protein